MLTHCRITSTCNILHSDSFQQTLLSTSYLLCRVVQMLKEQQQLSKTGWIGIQILSGNDLVLAQGVTEHTD